MRKRECPELCDDQVRLRALAVTDVKALMDATSDADIPKFTYWPARMSRSQAQARVEQAARGWDECSRLEFAVTKLDSNRLIGFAGLAPEWEAGVGEVFYWTAPWARRRGVAVRSVRLLCAWAFEELGIKTLRLETDADNIGSRRVAEVAGFTHEGLRKSQRVRADGSRCDSVIYVRGEPRNWP